MTAIGAPAVTQPCLPGGVRICHARRLADGRRAHDCRRHAKHETPPHECPCGFEWTTEVEE